MKAWFDTEFTDLNAPELLSVGIVTDAGQWHYAELLDDQLKDHASDFVVETVLPMFGTIPRNRASSYHELAAGTCDFLLAFSGSIELVYDYVTDRDLLEQALRTAPRWDELEARLTWVFAPAEAYDSGVGIAAMEATWRDQEALGLGRHHALADARALRAACLAVEEAAKR